MVASAQTLVRSFDGDKGMDLAACKPETMFCGRQPEMDVAVNGKQVVQVTRDGGYGLMEPPTCVRWGFSLGQRMRMLQEEVPHAAEKATDAADARVNRNTQAPRVVRHPPEVRRLETLVIAETRKLYRVQFQTRGVIQKLNVFPVKIANRKSIES